MTTDTQRPTTNISELEDSATARWLKDTLEPARNEVKAVPTAEAVNRMRERVFGEGVATSKQRKIAA
jgi:hypothetical protein